MTDDKLTLEEFLTEICKLRERLDWSHEKKPTIQLYFHPPINFSISLSPEHYNGWEIK